MALRLGAHVSIAGSLDLSVDRAVAKGCNTFQIFTRNPRGWSSKPLLKRVAKSFIDKVEQADIHPVFAHMPYLPNLASARENVYRKSVATLGRELSRCSKLRIGYLVTHLGSHLGAGKEAGLGRVTDAVEKALRLSPGDVMLLLENSAGSERAVGAAFEELKHIIDNVERSERLGLCFDTCHAFASGYDLRSDASVNAIVKKLDSSAGFERVKLVHANDSKGGLASRIDRHEHIGVGRIGVRGFRSLLRNTEFRNLPFIIETPVDDRRSDVENLELLRRVWGEAREEGSLSR